MWYATVFALGVISSQTILYLTKRNEKGILEQTIIEVGTDERSKIIFPEGLKIWINVCCSTAHVLGIQVVEPCAKVTRVQPNLDELSFA